MVDFGNVADALRWFQVQPREVAVVMAARAALRVLPIGIGRRRYIRYGKRIAQRIGKKQVLKGVPESIPRCPVFLLKFVLRRGCGEYFENGGGKVCHGSGGIVPLPAE